MWKYVMASWRSKRKRQSCGVVMLLLQVDALVVVVFMGVGACARVRGDVCSFVACGWWPDVTGHK